MRLAANKLKLASNDAKSKINWKDESFVRHFTYLLCYVYSMHALCSWCYG